MKVGHVLALSTFENLIPPSNKSPLSEGVETINPPGNILEEIRQYNIYLLIYKIIYEYMEN